VRSPAITTLLTLLLAIAGACADERRFAGGVHQVALTEDTPAAFTLEDAQLFVVETRIELPIRRPPDIALQDLRQAADSYDDLPYRRLPWVERGDVEVEIDFSLTNLDDESRQASVIVNGFNEFHEYVPGVIVVDDEATAEFAQWERLYALGPRERIERTIREEQLDEVAVDLATVVNGVDNPNNVVFFENQSATDERNREFIPEVVPGLAGLRLGLRATEAGNLLLEATVRVRDTADRLASEGEEPFRARPEPFMPGSVTGEAP
jgi:hypothetical protein